MNEYYIQTFEPLKDFYQNTCRDFLLDLRLKSHYGDSIHVSSMLYAYMRLFPEFNYGDDTFETEDKKFKVKIDHNLSDGQYFFSI